MPEPALTKASELLLRHAEPLQGPLLLLGAPDDALSERLSSPCHSVTTHYGDWLRQGEHSRNWHFGYDDPVLPRTVAGAIVFMPKARAELDLRLALAASRVTEGGPIALVGARKEGVAGGARRLLEWFPQAWKADSARHCQLWWARGTGTEGTFQVADYLKRYEQDVAGRSLGFYGLPGLFSEGRVDAGTRMLLESLQQVRSQGKEPMLDFACGSGLVGAWLRKAQPHRALTLSDVQWQALACTETLFRGQTDVSVQPSDGLAQVSGRFGLIITNPPFHEGVRADQSVTRRFLSEVRQRLVPGGELRLVANRFLPYAELMEKTLQSPGVIAEDGRYRVYQAFRPRR